MGVSDGNGDYTIPDLPAGSFIVYGLKEGFGTDFMTGVEVSAAGTVTAPDLRLSGNPGRVEGLVTVDGSPQAGVLVEILVRTNFANAWGIQKWATSTGDPFPNYSLEDLNPGLLYDVRVLATQIGGIWYAPMVRQNVSVTDGGATTVNFIAG